MEPVNCFVSVAVALGGFKSECIDLEINRENWVPVVIRDLRNDTLHDCRSSDAVMHYSQFVVARLTPSALLTHYYLQILPFTSKILTTF